MEFAKDVFFISTLIAFSGFILSVVGWLLYGLAELWVDRSAQNVPSAPEGWLRAIDEALIVTHLGVANAEDTYEQAREKLNNLIGWHIDVATDPAVNGGWKLTPMVSTHEMDMAGSDHCDGYLSKAQAVWDAMIAVAPNERSEYPEAKP
jgi:hypothetical protein